MQLMTQRPGIRAAQSTAEKLCLQLGTAISKSTLLLPAETRFTRAAEWTYLLLEELQWFAFAFRDISTIAPVFQPALLLWIAPVKDNLATCGIILSALVFAFIAVAAIALAQIDNQRAVSHALALFLAALLHLGNVFQIQLVAILFAGITAQLPLTPMYATALALFACISIAAPFFTAPASPKSHRLMAALMGTPFAITSGSVLVVVATEIFAADRLTLAITGGIVMTARVLYLWLRVPFYNSHVNSARIGLCTGALAALMATTITQFLLSGSLVLTSAQIIAPATICVVAPLVALLANKLQARRRAALVGRWQRIAKPDPWGPHTLMDAASHQAIFRALAQFSSAGKFEHQLAAAKSGFLDLKHGYDHERNVAASDDDGSNLCPPPRQPVPATPSSITKLGPLGILEQGPVKLPERVFSAPWELEFALRFLRKRPTPSQRSLALHMIWKGMQEYPDSNLVRLIAAEYLHLSFGKYPEAMSAVAKISPSHSRSFFTRGVLWTCRQQSVSVQDESPITATSSASKSLAARTQDAHLLSLFALKDFYEVVRTNGGTVRLTSVLARLAKHMRTARTGYDRLLAQDPRNGDVLRLYSIFVAQVEADAARAANLAELAVAEINRENGEHMVDNLNSQGSIGKQSNGTPTMPRSASISSGASSTRAVQLRARLRSLIHARIAAPLLQRFLVSVLAIAFLATVVGGYYSYSMFYQKTLNVINIYSSMRSARNSVLFTIEGVRGLVYSNNLMSAADFKSFNTTLVTKGLTIYNTSLAAMMALAASDPNPAVYRVYRSRASATSSDFAPYDLTANQVLDIVAQGAQLAMQNYPVLGALTPAAVTKVPEMRFLVDNFVTVMAAAKSLLASSMISYVNTNDQIVTTLWLWFGGSAAVIGLALAVIHFKVVRAFFRNIDQVMALIAAIPKTDAANLVTTCEEDIESFQDLFISEAQATGFGDRPDSQGAENVARLERERAAEATKNGGKDVRQKSLVMWIFGGLVTLALGVAIINVATLQSFSIAENLRSLMWSSERRFDVIALRSMTREFFSGSTAISQNTIVTMSRGAVSDMRAAQNSLLVQVDGLDAIMPNETSWPRDCGATSSNYCGAMSENAAVGWTRQIAAQTLNSEIDRFMAIADLVVDGMALGSPGVEGLSRTSALYANWQLMVLMSNDLATRTSNLHTTLVNYMLSRLASNQQSNLALVTAVIVLSVIELVIFFVMIERRLYREATALVAILHGIPAGVQSQIPRLSRFMDSGGLTLDIRDDEVGN